VIAKPQRSDTLGSTRMPVRVLMSIGTSVMEVHMALPTRTMYTLQCGVCGGVFQSDGVSCSTMKGRIHVWLTCPDCTSEIEWSFDPTEPEPEVEVSEYDDPEWLSDEPDDE